jgi:hypothetical protein
LPELSVLPLAVPLGTSATGTPALPEVSIFPVPPGALATPALPEVSVVPVPSGTSASAALASPRLSVILAPSGASASSKSNVTNLGRGIIIDWSYNCNCKLVKMTIIMLINYNAFPNVLPTFPSFTSIKAISHPGSTWSTTFLSFARQIVTGLHCQWLVFWPVFKKGIEAMLKCTFFVCYLRGVYHFFVNFSDIVLVRMTCVVKQGW